MVKKHPQSQVIINTDTSGAVFPEFVLHEQFYNNWTPGEDYPTVQEHHIDNLGLGIELEKSSAFFHFDALSKENSPIYFETDGQNILVHFDQDGLTAWAEDENEMIIPGTLVYDWAWKNFFPNTIEYQ